MLLTALIIVVAMIIVTSVSVSTAENAILDESAARARMAAESIEETCQLVWAAQPYPDPDEHVLLHRGDTWRDDLQSKLTRLLQTANGFLEVVVFETGSDGRLRFLAGSKGATRREPNDLDLQVYLYGQVLNFVRDASGHRLEMSRPLHDLNSDMRGTIAIKMSLAKADEALASARSNIIQWTAMVTIAAAAILLIYFHGTVSKPVRALVTLVERIRQGDLAARSHLHGAAEIGWLARNFDLMVKSLETGERENRALLKQVRDFNEVLQEQVRVATLRLHETNETVMRLQRDMSRQERLASLGQLATTLAHEIGTPLNALSGHLQLLRQDPALGEANRSRLTIMEAQVDRLTAIIRNVLQTMRMPEPQFERVDLNKLIADLLQFVRPMLRFRGIKLEVEEYPDLPAVLADSQQLQQVLMNLVSNAIEAMQGGGQLTIATGYLPAGGGSIRDAAVLIRVTDTGPGIGADQMERLFTPYFTTKSLGLGSGLGLVISRQILRGHGGDISAESEAGKGTSFSLVLPCAPAETASARGKSPQPADARVNRKS